MNKLLRVLLKIIRHFDYKSKASGLFLYVLFKNMTWAERQAIYKVTEINKGEYVEFYRKTIDIVVKIPRLDDYEYQLKQFIKTIKTEKHEIAKNQSRNGFNFIK